MMVKMMMMVVEEQQQRMLWCARVVKRFSATRCR
jgi:hypothetical protein